jgi:hypothetical protein
MFYYHPFDSSKDGSRFLEDMNFLIKRNFYHDIVMKIRCSKGKKKKSFLLRQWHFSKYFIKV